MKIDIYYSSLQPKNILDYFLSFDDYQLVITKTTRALFSVG